MIKPKALKYGDTVAIVSLSSGMGGDDMFYYRYLSGKERLEKIFGLKVITMPNALKGSEFLKNHPEKRAEDLMQAFQDPKIKGIICMIGGDDSIRLLPYINYDIIRKNPKIFMGYSDSTVNHFMMYKAGLVSFYGPCVLVEFAENQQMHEYTIASIKRTLFHVPQSIDIAPSPKWTSEFLDWSNMKNQNVRRKMQHDNHGFEVLQGTGIATGELIGGCLGVFKMIIGTELWLEPSEWEGKILFLETGEDYPVPNEVCYFLRNLVAQGIIDKLNGIIVGKPLDERYYDEYKQIYKTVICNEANQPNLPILYNVNFGHTSPVSILPYGVMAQIDCSQKKLTVIESPIERDLRSRNGEVRDER